VRGKFPRKRLRKGVSDLVVILTLVAIAIPVALAVQGWLGAQASRMNSYVATPELQATLISKAVNTEGQVFILRLKNSGDSPYGTDSLKGRAILVNGTIADLTVKAASAGSKILPGSSITLSAILKDPKAKVKSIVIEATNLDTGMNTSVTVSVA